MMKEAVRGGIRYLGYSRKISCCETAKCWLSRANSCDLRPQALVPDGQRTAVRWEPSMHPDAQRSAVRHEYIYSTYLLELAQRQGRG